MTRLEEPARTVGPVSLLIWQVLVSAPFGYTLLVYGSHLTSWPLLRDPGRAPWPVPIGLLGVAFLWATVMQPDRQWLWIGRTLGATAGYAFFAGICSTLGSVVGIRSLPLRLTVAQQKTLFVLKISVLADRSFRDYYRNQCPGDQRFSPSRMFYNGECLQVGKIYAHSSNPDLPATAILPGEDTTVAPLPRLLTIRRILAGCALIGIERDGEQVAFIESVAAMQSPLRASGLVHGPEPERRALRIRGRYLHLSRYEPLGNNWYYFEVNGLAQADSVGRG